MFAAISESDRWEIGLPLAISPDKHLRDLTNDERRLACAWHERNATTSRVFAGSHLGAGNKGECLDDGSSFEVLDLRSCVERFPQCDDTVAQVQDCVRYLYVDPCGATAMAKACQKVRACNWGVSFAQTK